MKKGKIFAAFLAGTIITTSAWGSAPSPTQTRLDPIPDATPTLNKYILKLKELEELGVPVKKYKAKQKEFIVAYIEERKAVYKTINLIQTTVCSARASKPSAFKGRNSDSCSVSLPTKNYQGKWLYDHHNTSELHKLMGGKTGYNVASSADKSAVSLSVNCSSPKWNNTDSGHCGLKIKISATFKMSDRDILKAVKAEALSLLQ